MDLALGTFSFVLIVERSCIAPSPKTELHSHPSVYFSYREALGDLTSLTSDSDSDSNSDSDIGEGK